MSTTPSSQELTYRPPAKKLRLGTRSCAECRAHKVRCIFPDGSQTCQYCARHDRSCKPQQVAQETQSPGEDFQGNEALRRRLKVLEDAVLRMSKDQESTGQSKVVSLEKDGCDSDLELQGVISPFDGLLRESQLVQEARDSTSRDQQKPALGIYVASLVDEIRPTLGRKALEVLLSNTEPLWSTWPLYFFGPTRADTFQAGQVKQTVGSLLAALGSNRPAITAKALSWIALCCQQMPLQTTESGCDSVQWTDGLVDRYLTVAAQLLAFQEEDAPSLDGLESVAMYSRAVMDNGDLRKAWLWSRKAVTMAVSLGLHRVNATTDERRQDIWSLVWMFERAMSAFLGMPSSVSTQHPGLDADLYKGSVASEIMYKMSILQGDLIHRDQNHNSLSYATTVQMDQEASEIYSLFPAEWWDQSTLHTLPFPLLFLRQTMKIRYFILLKMIHLPYMLRHQEQRYAHSFSQAMAASRGILRAYCDFRYVVHAKTHLCQTMDFQAFTAALTLAVGSKSKARHCSSNDDWELIEECRICLGSVTTTMSCKVAEQAADVLHKLIGARNGGIQLQGEHVAVFPFFGRLRLNLAGFTEPIEQNQTGLSPANFHCQRPLAEQMQDSANIPSVFPTPPGSKDQDFTYMFGYDPFRGTTLGHDQLSSWGNTTGGSNVDWLSWDMSVSQDFNT